MSEPQPTKFDEVEQLMRNAQLRDELERYGDESITVLDTRAVPTPVENEFLASMLAWERAPVLPIARWFEPALALPAPDTLDDAPLRDLLWSTIHKLFSKRIVLDFTDHLSDRQLYCLIFRDILPACEKKIDNTESYLHWDCAGVGDDVEVWLRFYASDEEREDWAEQFPEDPIPGRESPPFPRRLPRRPL
ncbi:MAG: hypothetical protein JSS27_21065 [Planctomycetes bacterium]|nr:hypothetical protein [Planctomycetota bacterium]